LAQRAHRRRPLVIASEAKQSGNLTTRQVCIASAFAHRATADKSAQARLAMTLDAVLTSQTAFQFVIARLDRAIQYAAAYRLKHSRLWNTGCPA
jgi:hypothetical protein